MQFDPLRVKKKYHTTPMFFVLQYHGLHMPPYQLFFTLTVASASLLAFIFCACSTHYNFVAALQFPLNCLQNIILSTIVYIFTVKVSTLWWAGWHFSVTVDQYINTISYKQNIAATATGTRPWQLWFVNSIVLAERVFWRRKNVFCLTKKSLF